MYVKYTEKSRVLAGGEHKQFFMGSCGFAWKVFDDESLSKAFKVAPCWSFFPNVVKLGQNFTAGEDVEKKNNVETCCYQILFIYKSTTSH